MVVWFMSIRKPLVSLIVHQKRVGLAYLQVITNWKKNTISHVMFLWLTVRVQEDYISTKYHFLWVCWQRKLSVEGLWNGPGGLEMAQCTAFASQQSKFAERRKVRRRRRDPWFQQLFSLSIAHRFPAQSCGVRRSDSTDLVFVELLNGLRVSIEHLKSESLRSAACTVRLWFQWMVPYLTHITVSRANAIAYFGR